MGEGGHAESMEPLSFRRRFVGFASSSPRLVRLVLPCLMPE